MRTEAVSKSHDKTKIMSDVQTIPNTCCEANAKSVGLNRSANSGYPYYTAFSNAGVYENHSSEPIQFHSHVATCTASDSVRAVRLHHCSNLAAVHYSLGYSVSLDCPSVAVRPADT